MKHVLRVAAVLVCALVLSGCGSIIKSNKQTVSFRSLPPGARVEVLNHKRQLVFTGETPTKAKLRTKRGFFARARYTVNYEKKGFVPVTAQLDGTVRNWFWLNLPIPFMVVDAATGAMWKLDTDGGVISTTLKPTY